MNSRLPLVGFLLVVAILPPEIQIAQAQETSSSDASPRATPIIRSATHLVQLSVVVTDKKGAPITGLQKEDFTVLDESRPQEIAFFAPPPPQTVASTAPLLPKNVFTNRFDLKGQDPGIVTVVLFDLLNTSPEDQEYVRKQAIKFLKSLKPQDRVAVYALTTQLVLIHDFTQDASTLIDAVNKIQPKKLGTYDAAHPALCLDCGDPTLATMINGANGQIAEQAKANQQEITTKALEMVAQHVAAIPGHKSLIWVSGSFPLQITLTVRDHVRAQNPGGETASTEINATRASRALNRADMAIYPVDATGVASDPGMSPKTNIGCANCVMEAPGPTSAMYSRENNRDTERMLADATGGEAFYGSNDITTALGKALGDGTHAYTIAFYPDHGKWDGKFRKIKIRVKSNGSQVRYRSGYFADAEHANTEAQAKAALQNAAQSPLDATSLGMIVDAKLLGQAEERKFELHIGLDPKQLQLQTAANHRKGAVDLYFVQRDSQGNTLAAENQRVALDLEEQQYTQMSKTGLVLSRRLTILPRTVELRVLARDTASEAIGSVTIPAQALLDRSGTDTAIAKSHDAQQPVNMDGPAASTQTQQQQKPATVPSTTAPADLPQPQQPAIVDQPTIAPDTQQQQKPATIRSTTRLVQVSVVVTDKQGNPVTGLRKEDFSVLDESNPQEIAFFSAESPAPVAPSQPLPKDVFTNRYDLKGQDPGAVTVVLFDSLNTSPEDQGYVRQQVIKFLRTLKPQDHVAVYALTTQLLLLHEFTQDSSALANAASQFTPKELAAYDSSHPPVFHVAALDNDVMFKKFEDAVNQTSARIADQAKANRAETTAEALTAIANHVATIPGRKNLVWVSGSFPLQILVESIGAPDRATQSLDAYATQAARALNRVDMSLYPVDAQGVTTSPNMKPEQQDKIDCIDCENEAPKPSPAMFSRQNDRDSERLLADATGGQAFYGSNDIALAMRRAFDDRRYAYTIGFYPNNAKWNGKFRRIKVHTKIEGVKLRYRTGYYAEAEGTNREEVNAKAALQQAAMSPLDATSLGMIVTGKPAGAAEERKVELHVGLDPKQLFLQGTENHRKGAVSLYFVQRDAKGVTIAAENQRVGVDLEDKQYDYLATAGLVLVRHLTIVPQATELRVFVRDTGSEALGSVTIPVAELLDASKIQLAPPQSDIPH
jgi:VWFA-related protein